jgi:hypothetical protein
MNERNYRGRRPGERDASHGTSPFESELAPAFSEPRQQAPASLSGDSPAGTVFARGNRVLASSAYPQ